ncbi:hypothetical protein EVAR_8213_1 [Eumeta japonica]|uniref:Uncharacterized protein n=1 Tax=Eumeta variegata TaxID=151549 RepID=A0A4C1TI78_EUMVA|nr:hypothetical protein EVAR_8213_1 [Eumeta japonica]
MLTSAQHLTFDLSTVVVTWWCFGSISGLALALGSSGVGSPAGSAAPADTATSSRAPSPPPNDRPPHSRIDISFTLKKSCALVDVCNAALSWFKRRYRIRDFGRLSHQVNYTAGVQTVTYQCQYKDLIVFDLLAPG